MINPGDYEILVVEDSAIQAELLRRRLAEEGYKVSVAENGVKALAMIRKKKPSLIISDIVMPLMDGYKMCHEIKYDDELKDIPVILLTNLSDPNDVIKELDSKADNYLTKPYNDQLLFSRVESLLIGASVSKDTSQQCGLEINYGGETHVITSGPQEILNLLISTYETASYQNRELIKAQSNLKSLNQELDIKLRELQWSEERESVLVQMIPDIVYRIDSEGRFSFINNAVHRLGYQPETLSASTSVKSSCRQTLTRSAGKMSCPTTGGKTPSRKGPQNFLMNAGPARG